MKKKVGTVLEENVLSEAKQRAARENRSLADVIQEALTAYLHTDPDRRDAERACERFCADGGSLSRAELAELLQEDMLVSQ